MTEGSLQGTTARHESRGKDRTASGERASHTTSRERFRLLGALLPEERGPLVGLVLLIVARGMSELLGLGAVAPFLAVASDPGTIARSPLLTTLYEAGGFASHQSFTMALGGAVALSLTAGNLLAVVATRRTAAFATEVTISVSRRLLAAYLARPYAFHQRQHTAQLQRVVMQESEQLGLGVVQGMLNLVGQSVVVLTAVGVLLRVNPVVSTLLMAGLTGTFAASHFLSRRRIRAAGELRIAANRMRNKVVNEALTGIRELKVLQREDVPVQRFADAAEGLADTQATIRTLPLVPRYLVEVVLAIVLVVAIIVMLGRGQSPASLLPTLSVYVFAGIRVLPALQGALAAVTTVVANEPVIDEISSALFDPAAGVQERTGVPAPVFARRVALRDLTFRYPDAAVAALDGVTLDIPRGATVGVIGRSGSGKSTLADLLVGLQWPSGGTISVDDVVVDHATVRGWRSMVGYVPQTIFLADDSILGNIALGVPAHEVDRGRALRVAELAQLSTLLAELPLGIDAVVGERGVRLSGGQRQRIGIARALYRQPQLLVLDEATSALDTLTERLLMEAVFSEARAEQRDTTVLVIAHRLATVRDCSSIVLMREGRVVDQGTWEALEARSAEFRELAALSEE